MRYRQSQRDDTLFIKHSSSMGVSTFLMYVNNIIVIENNDKGKKILYECLASSGVTALLVQVNDIIVTGNDDKGKQLL